MNTPFYSGTNAAEYKNQEDSASEMSKYRIPFQFSPDRGESRDVIFLDGQWVDGVGLMGRDVPMFGVHEIHMFDNRFYIYNVVCEGMQNSAIPCPLCTLSAENPMDYTKHKSTQMSGVGRAYAVQAFSVIDMSVRDAKDGSKSYFASRRSLVLKKTARNNLHQFVAQNHAAGNLPNGLRGAVVNITRSDKKMEPSTGSSFFLKHVLSEGEILKYIQSQPEANGRFIATEKTLQPYDKRFVIHRLRTVVPALASGGIRINQNVDHFEPMPESVTRDFLEQFHAGQAAPYAQQPQQAVQYAQQTPHMPPPFPPTAPTPPAMPPTPAYDAYVSDEAVPF